MRQLERGKGLKLLCLLVLSICGAILIPSVLSAEPSTTVKKYPPYPDVWGYELPWPDKTSRLSGISIYKLEDGDYLAYYIARDWEERRKDGSCCEFRIKVAGVSFFSGKKWGSEEVNDFAEKHREDRVPREFSKPHPWVFEDGSELQQGGGTAGRCPNFLRDYLMMLDQKKNTVAEKRLIYLLDKPLKRPACHPKAKT